METALKWILGVPCAVIVAFVFYCMFIVMPVVMYTEAECLKAGFPKYHVTVGLERYCSNLAGTVTVKVEKQ